MTHFNHFPPSQLPQFFICFSHYQYPQSWASPQIRNCGLTKKVADTRRRVARIWKRGGLFWKSEKCANDLDSNFYWPWISFRRFVRNLRRNVSERSEIQRFFRPKLGDLQKRSSQIQGDFSPNLASSNVWGGALFVWGGLFSIFHRKSASTAQKTCVFAYFTSQWGGLEPPRPPPPPGYATGHADLRTLAV